MFPVLAQDAQGPFRGTSLAVMGLTTEIAELLISTGADVNATAEYGRPRPAIGAIQFGGHEVRRDRRSAKAGASTGADLDKLTAT